MSVVFLYAILGWRYVLKAVRFLSHLIVGSTFVGVGTMVAMFVIPGLISKLSRDIQVEKMKKVCCVFS